MKYLLWSVLLAIAVSGVFAQHDMTNSTDSLFASPDEASATPEPSAEPEAEPEPQAEGEPEPEPEAESEPEPEPGQDGHDGHEGHDAGHDATSEPEPEPEPKLSEANEEPVVPLSNAQPQESANADNETDSRLPEPSKQDSSSTSLMALPALLTSMFLGLCIIRN